MQKSIQHHLELAPHLEKRELVQQEHEQVGPDHQFRPADAAQGRARAIPARASVHLSRWSCVPSTRAQFYGEQHPRALKRPRRPPAHFAGSCCLSSSGTISLSMVTWGLVGRGAHDGGRLVVALGRQDAPARRGHAEFLLRRRFRCPSDDRRERVNAPIILAVDDRAPFFYRGNMPLLDGTCPRAIQGRVLTRKSGPPYTPGP